MSERREDIRGSTSRHREPPLGAADRPLTGSSVGRPGGMDQPTVVSKHPPLSAPAVVSDSAYRILHGTIESGDRLGHFELLEYVGGGGMGRVFRAFDTRLARYVAVKILPSDQASDEETRLRFQNEAQSAARLDHENIARVFYVGEDHGLQYIVFEYIEGENIRDLVDRTGPLSLADAISFTLQITDALAHAAERAVVHRDIKPSNVLITREGHAKLIDMGLARLRQVDAVDDLTASGVTLGTFDYISPEQARDPRNADVRSDIYSLGCTLFFMLTGRPPFPTGTVLQKLLQHQADQPPDVREFRSDIPDELVRIMRKMLAKDPRSRYQSPQPLVDELLQLAQRLGLQPIGPNKRVWMPRGEPSRVRWQRHLPWAVPLAMLVAMVASFPWLWPLIDRGAALLSEPPGGATGEGLPRLPPAEGEGRAETPRPPAPPGGAVDPRASPSLGPLGDDGQPSDRSDGLPGRTPPTIGEPSGTAVESAAPAATRGAGATGNLPISSGTNGANGDLPTRSESPARSESPTRSESPAAPATPTGEPNRTPPNGAPSSAVLLPPAGTSVGWPGASSAAAREWAVPPAGLPTGTLWAAPATDGIGEIRTSAGRIDLAPATGPMLRRGRVLIVDGEGGRDGRFVDLAEACAAADEGDVVELACAQTTIDRPWNMTQSRLTIRAAAGFQPVLLLEMPANESARLDTAALVTLGGKLALVDVRLRISAGTVRRSKAAFALAAEQAVRMERCVVSVEGDGEASVSGQRWAVFQFSGRAPAPRTDEARHWFTPPRVELSNVVVRGDAHLLLADDAASGRLIWNNGVFAGGESLFVVEELSVGDETEGSEGLTIELSHLTALASGGILRWTRSADREGPHALELRVSDSVFAGNRLSPLIECVGFVGAADVQRALRYQGDGNLYDGFDHYLAVRGKGSESAKLLPFEEWSALWGAQRESSTAAPVPWRSRPDPGRPAWQTHPAELLVDLPRDDMATMDGRPVGADISVLPDVRSD